jgi:hemolysin III
LKKKKIVSRVKGTRQPKRTAGKSQKNSSSARVSLADALKRRARHARFRRAMRHEIANLLTHGIGAGLAIAGTYTRILLLTLRGALGWTFFGIVWGLAAWRTRQAPSSTRWAACPTTT